MTLGRRVRRVLLVLPGTLLVLGSADRRAGSLRGAPGLPCPGPAGDWVATSLEGAPTSRPPLAAWTGSGLLVMSANGEGALLDVCVNRWSHVSSEGVPPHLALYGDRFNPPVVAGHYLVFLHAGPYQSVAPFASMSSAVIYDIERHRWSVAGARGAPSLRTDAVVAGTGREVIVWGGRGKRPDGGEVWLGDGARLDPATGRWRPLSTVRAPSPRTAGSAGNVWTGTRLVIWDGGITPRTALAHPCATGESCSLKGDGAMYDPKADRWTPIATVGAPTKRFGGYALAHGHEVVFWGGSHSTDGGVLDVPTNTWRSLPPGPSEFIDDRFPRLFRVYLDGDHLVVISPHMRAATFGLSDGRWSMVQGHPPAFSGFLPDFVFEDPSVTIHLSCHFAGGSIPTRQCMQSGWIARVQVDVPRWEVAHFPAPGAPPSEVHAWTVWTGDRLVVWGGSDVAFDSTGQNGCEGAHQPCDPVTPTKSVFRREGGVLLPVFSPSE
jgi:hypothetical protein